MEQKNLSWKEAVITVLKDAKEPMHYVEIASKIQELGLRDNFGATPHISVNTVIQQNKKYILPADERGCYYLKSSVTNISSATQQKQTANLIKAFGRYWDRTELERHNSISGQQGNGTLVDFSNEIGFYILHRGYESVYVGQVTRQSLLERLRQHTKDRLSMKWDKFSWFGFYGLDKDGKIVVKTKLPSLSMEKMADLLEALLIECMEPRFNNKRGNDLSLNEYEQYR